MKTVNTVFSCFDLYDVTRNLKLPVIYVCSGSRNGILRTYKRDKMNIS